MKIQLLPAENGDCILVEHAPGHYFVIDGGYVDTARKYLMPRLEAISGAGGTVDVMVVTHIDEDHISGIIEYMEKGARVPVGEIWYNGYRHIQSTADPLPVSEEKEPNFKHKEIAKEANPPMISPCGIKQGCTLSTWIARRKIPWNVPAEGKAMMAPMSFQVGETKVHLLSPNEKDLEKLEKFWRKDLVDKKFVDKAHSQEYWDDAYEWLIAKEEADKKGGFKQHAEDVLPMNRLAIKKTKDRIEEALEQKYERDGSVANRSSISFVLETPDGTRALLLGDAHAETIIDSLKALYGEDAAPYHFDVVKLAHHGSFNNTSPALLDLIRSDKWLVSTNSATFHHPEMATLANIVTRSTGNKIFFNYELDICKELRKEEYKKYGFEIVTPAEQEVGMTVAVPEGGPFVATDEPVRPASPVKEKGPLPRNMWVNPALGIHCEGGSVAIDGEQTSPTPDPEAVESSLKRGIINKAVLDQLTEDAKKSERRRMNLDLRNSPEDKSQRMLNAVEPGTMLPIHRHKNSSETVVCLRGHFQEFFYDDAGKTTAIIDMIPGGCLLNIPAGQWHNLKSFESGTVLLECKEGPYEPLGEDDILDPSRT